MFGPVLQHIGEIGSWGGGRRQKFAKPRWFAIRLDRGLIHIRWQNRADRRNERKPVVVAVRKCKIFGVKTVPFSREVWFISAMKLAQK